ncbi:MAG: LapA family protein [Pseudomonadota bacterium]
MRYLRYLFYIVLGIALITVAIANRGSVTLNLLPDDMAGLMGFSWQVQLPLFIIIFAAIIAGLLIGFVVEWFRERKHRSEARVERRSRQKLEKELNAIKPSEKAGDDILAILDETSAAR